MQRAVTSIALAGMLSLGAGLIVAAAPEAAAWRGGHGPGAGMMGHGGWGFADPAAYLGDLKVVLGITTAQEPAWNVYADAVNGAADQMRGAHATMFDAMGTATWQERRDMMNRMFETRRESFDKVHAAAQQLLPQLDAAQRTKAETRLPGLVSPGRGHGMMGMGMGPGPGPRRP